jgi:hypothetical protein
MLQSPEPSSAQYADGKSAGALLAASTIAFINRASTVITTAHFSICSALSRTNGVGDAHGIKRIGLEADGVGMRQCRILLCILRHPVQIVIATKYPQRADPHQGTVRLAFRVEPPAKPVETVLPQSKGRHQPIYVCLSCFLGIMASLLDQHPSPHQRHLRIVSRLPGNRPPCSAISGVNERFPNSSICMGHGFGPRPLPKGKIVPIERNLRAEGWLPNRPGTYNVVVSTFISKAGCSLPSIMRCGNLHATATIHVLSE